ncbi:serine protease filzig [Bacillus rossius redtenbacheri]|uniref:serine protease filzig n=1 Tax=Bacillus rossius redtenbacheri TaxID=93214 RepID=UPI002FDD5DB4
MRPLSVTCLLFLLGAALGFSIAQLPDGSSGRKLFGGYRIVPKPCHSRSGQQGICMFNYECTQRNGEVVSACVDGFLFGSCCRLPDGATFQLPDPDLEVTDTYHPTADHILQHASSHTPSTRPLPQADTVLLHQNGSVVADANNPEEVFHPSASHLEGSHGEGETIIMQSGLEKSTISSVDSNSFSKWQAAIVDDSRVETASHFIKPVKTVTATDGKHTTFYALDTSKKPFPLGTTIGRPFIPDATEMNEIDGNEVFTKEASSVGPIYYSSRWPSSRPSPGHKTPPVTKLTEKPFVSSSTNKFSDSDDGMVPVPVITFDKGQNKRPPSHEQEPVPEPEPYPESHSESINHILSILNDSNLGVINSGIQPFMPTLQPDSRPGISTWGLIDGLPAHSWEPNETAWSSSMPSISTDDYKGNYSKNSTIFSTTQHFPGLSTISNNYVSKPMIPVTSVDYLKKPNMTKKPVPTVIVLQNIASDYTTHWPSSHYSSNAGSYQNTIRPTGNMHHSSYITKIPIFSSSTTKNPAINIFSNSYMYNTTTASKKPNNKTTNIIKTSTVATKPTVHLPAGMGNHKNSTSSYIPTAIFSSMHDYPQSTASIYKKPSGHITGIYQSSTENLSSEILSLSSEASHDSTTNMIYSSSASSPSSIFSTWTQDTTSETKPLSVTFLATRPDSSSNRPTTLSQLSKPSGTNIPSQHPTTLNNNDEDLVNFPPVRNPQLNMTSIGQQENPLVVQSTDEPPGFLEIIQDNEVSTPPFEENDKLKIKLHSFVSKIVNSLQQNFLELEDVVVKTGNNFSSTIGTAVSSRPGTTTGRPVKVTSSRRPTPSLQGSTTKRPIRISTSARPVSSTQRPISTSRRPITSQRPRPTANQATSPRPTVRPRPTSPTTRKPKPSRRPTTGQPPAVSTTTRRPRPRPTTRRTTTSSTVSGQQEASTRPTPTKRPTKRTTTTPATAEETSADELNTSTIVTSSTTARPVDYKRECGVRPLMKNGRIVGGKGATFGAWPWQVLVKESTWLGLFTKNKCGGVLITARFVITAAHCQPGFLANLVAVMGEFDISGELESRRSVTKNVKRVIVHRQYDAATFANDLSLLELDTPVAFDKHIVPICMPRDGEDFTGRMATVTGWGRLKYGGGVPSVLQEVQVPIIENSVCQEMFHTAGHSKVILSSFMCAGYANGQRDSCEGDSGGPLMMERDDGRYVLVGTVSHGIKCAAPYLPGVYMRTTYYKPWLRSITGVQ